MFQPHVEDWVTPEDNAFAVHPQQPYGLAGQGLHAWLYEELATERWLAATQVWVREAPRIDMPIRERRVWQLGLGAGGWRPKWRDQAAFMAQTDLRALGPASRSSR